MIHIKFVQVLKSGLYVYTSKRTLKIKLYKCCVYVMHWLTAKIYPKNGNDWHINVTGLKDFRLN